MNRIIRTIFTSDVPVAPVPLVFVSFALMILMQLFLMTLIPGDHLYLRATINEIIVISGLPIFFIMFFRFDRNLLLSFMRPAAVIIALVIIVTLSADIVIDYFTVASEQLFPLPDRVKEIYDNLMSASGTNEILWKSVVLCVLPAFCEEIFFRGFCQTSLSAKWGNKIAIIVTAFLFAVVHFNPWHLHLYFILGVLLGWVYSSTGSLWAPILCHFLNNLWTFLNHILGFKVPLVSPFGWTDMTFLGGGVTFFIMSAILLRAAHNHTGRMQRDRCSMSSVQGMRRG